MSIAKDLFQIANELSPYTEFKSDEIEALIEAANEIGKSWSGSWLGYHSRVYYEGFISPPPGARFSQEWGFLSHPGDTTGDWDEFNFDDVVLAVREKAGNPDLEKILAQSNEAEEAFEEAKSSALSLIHSNFEGEWRQVF